MAKPKIGEPAPSFSGQNSSGATVRLEDYLGKIVVLEWTNHECPYVEKHYGTRNMQTLQKEATSKGIVWISIISSAPGKQGFVSAEKANELTVSRGAAPSEVLLDPEGKIGRLYRARTTPHMFVIDPSGTLAYMGGIDDRPSARWSDVKGANNYVRAAIDSLLIGKKIDVSISRPYGCSVKY
jgi:peroxiredoxin